MKIKLHWRIDSGDVSKNEAERSVKSVASKFLDKSIEKIEVSISLVSEKEIARLNKKYLNRIGITDVLSFPLGKDIGPDKIMRLGDIVICWLVAKKQAKEKGVDVQEEVNFLIEHAMLHLLGIHH